MEQSGIMQSALVLWDLSIWVVGGVSGRVLAVKRLTFNVMHIASGVTVSIHHFALLINTRISLVYLELPLASEPRGISSKSCKALSFSRFQLVPAILFFTGTREIFTHKPWHVLVWQRLCITPLPHLRPVSVDSDQC